MLSTVAIQDSVSLLRSALPECLSFDAFNEASPPAAMLATHLGLKSQLHVAGELYLHFVGNECPELSAWSLEAANDRGTQSMISNRICM